MAFLRKITPSDNPVRNYYPVRSVFDDILRLPESWDDFINGQNLNLAVDMWEENDSIKIKMALPGVNPDNVDISVTGDMVTIKGQAKNEEEQKDSNKRYYYQSLSSSFEQTFNLPVRVDSNNAKASCENGILLLELPKAEDVKPKQIKISV